MRPAARHRRGFTLVEVVLALGIVSFSVLVVVGLLSVANETNRRAREEAFAARLAADEFERVRSLVAADFPASPYSRFFDADLRDLGTTATPPAVYELAIDLVTPPVTSAPADRILNAEVRFPVGAPPANQTKFLYTTLINVPLP